MIPSNITIELLKGTTLTFCDDIGDGAIWFMNSDTTNGNSNICIHGDGVFDGNMANQTGSPPPTQTFVNFTNVTDSVIDLYLQNLRGKYVHKIYTHKFTETDTNITYINRHHRLSMSRPELPNTMDLIMAKAEFEVIDEVDSGWGIFLNRGTMNWDYSDFTRGNASIYLTDPYDAGENGWQLWTKKLLLIQST